MKRFMADHRALFGSLGVAALASLFLSLGAARTPLALELALVAAALLGVAALVGSPYWSILYRESPLRRAAAGTTDLDERELALRDRASGLTYFLFVTLNVVAVALCATLASLGKLEVDSDMLFAALVPYAWLGVSLPVILLEWFEPSGRAARAAGEEEE